jgi:cobalt-zinc-cadmium efflux system membrane fusion protein
LVAHAQEKDLHHIYLHQEITFTMDAYPQRSFHALVNYISPVLDETTRTIQVTATLDNSKGIFKPNLFVKAMFLTRPQQRFVLPTTAVLQRGFDSLVFVEVRPWVFEARAIQTGLQFDNQVEILGGLMEKERVAITGGLVLND